MDSGELVEEFNEAELIQEFELRRSARIAEEDGPSTYSGQEIPEAIWMRTSVDGLPDWKPGIYDEVRCPDAFWEWKGEVIPRTIDVYIPMAYQERPDDLFPIVVMAGTRPMNGFYGLIEWAERNEVILVKINSSTNKTYDRNSEAQIAAVTTIYPTLRFDRRLGFGLGMSGAAASAWEMVCRFPDNFAGLVMMGMGDGHNGCWIPRHVHVAYIHGREEPNNRSIARAIEDLRLSGNEIREQIVPGAHVMGPVEVREHMLSWMLDAARSEHGTRTIHDLNGEGRLLAPD